jgi:hypothetical protein
MIEIQISQPTRSNFVPSRSALVQSKTFSISNPDPRPTPVLSPATVGSDALSIALFDRLVSLKVTFAEIAMHVDRDWRSGIFSQLDKLLDVDNWDPDDTLPTDQSFRTFLRLILYVGPMKRPSLGASPGGNIIAGWLDGKSRLQIECAPFDKVTWILAKWQGEVRESAAGETMVRRLPEVLRPYEPKTWFSVV